MNTLNTPSKETAQVLRNVYELLWGAADLACILRREITDDLFEGQRVILNNAIQKLEGSFEPLDKLSDLLGVDISKDNVTAPAIVANDIQAAGTTHQEAVAEDEVSGEDLETDQEKLRPAWFYYDSDDREIDIRETIDNLASDLDAMGDLISSVNDEVSRESIHRVGWMLMDKSKECRAFSTLIRDGGAV